MIAKRSAIRFVAILTVSYLCLVAVFFIWGERWTRLSLPLVKAKVEWLNRGYRVDSVSLAMLQNQPAIAVALSGTREAMTSTGSAVFDHAGTTKIYCGNLYVYPMMALPLVAAFPFGTARRKTVALALSLAVCVIASSLDAALLVTYLHESGFYQELARQAAAGGDTVKLQQPGWANAYWHHFINNGGRAFLSIVIAASALGIAGVVGRLTFFDLTTR